MANRKYTKRDTASTMEVIKGLAMTAGSRPMALATRGSTAPTSYASSTVTNKARQTTASMTRVIRGLPKSSRSTSQIYPKHTMARARPQITAVRISFQITRGRSEKCSSPRLRARITVTED